MKPILFAALAFLALPALGQRSVLYDTSTYRLILPTNITGMTFGGTLVTNLAGTGLTISSGTLQVNTSVIATDAEVAAGYQPLDATLTAVAGASTGANTLVYFSASDTAAVTTFTSWGRGLVDDADQTAARITLGLVPGTDVQAYDADLAAVAGLASNGLVVRTGAGTVAARTITGDSEITVSNGDGVSGNPTLALAASITRDSELSVYALLAGPTFTGDPKAPTPGANDNDTSIATTAFVEARAQSLQSSNLWQSTNATLTRLAGIGGGTEGDIIYRDSTGWTNLTRGANGNVLTATASTIQWSAPSSGSFEFWADWNDWESITWSFPGGASAGSIEPHLTFTAVAGGVNGAQSAPSGLGNNFIRTVASAVTSSGGYLNAGTSIYALTNRATQFQLVWYPNRTNGAISRLGFGDSTTTTEPADALMFAQTNDVIWPVALNNGVKTVASSGYTVQQGVGYTLKIFQTNDFARFIVMSNVIGAADVEVYNDTISSGLPLGSTRVLGLLVGGYNTSTANTNGVDILYFDQMGLRRSRR